MTVVIGGGLSGLSAAYYLIRRFVEPVTIYESSNRLGGWIRTELHNDKGFIFEAGPRTIRPKGISGANTLELIENLNLPVEGIPSNHAAARNRMIYAKGHLCLLPNSIGAIFRKLPPFSKPLASSFLNEYRVKSKKAKNEDESIYDFVERRFGSEVAQYAISPLICGICAGDAKEISVRFLMSDLFDKEQQYGSIVKGIIFSKLQALRNKKTAGIFIQAPSTLYEKAQQEKWSMYRIKDGLESLPRKLASHLQDNNVNINLSSDCRDIIFTENGARINIKGKEVEANQIIASLPSYKLAKCVKSQHPSLAGLLEGIPYVDVAVVNLQYNASDILKQNAFGFLVPPVERLPILGVIFDSCCFDMEGNTVLTVMMGGKWFETNFGINPTQKMILDVALQHVDLILGIKHEPKTVRVHMLHKCIPQYIVGHTKRVASIRRYIEQYKLPLWLCGAAYDGVGINDVILSARQTVNSLPKQI